MDFLASNSQLLLEKSMGSAEKLMEKMHLGQEEALEKTALYWKE